MAIRLRVVDGQLVALCAARSVEKPGDVYLDDNAHYALSQKYWLDYADHFTEPIVPELDAVRRIWQEESDNPNREWWDGEYGADNPLNEYFRNLLTASPPQPGA